MISNREDIIDSRDIIKRIEELKAGLENIEDEDVRAEIKEELAPLLALAEEAGGYAPDWEHGVTLISDDYFEDYAGQFAEDIGAISSDAQWPNNHIDWEAASDALKMDYTEVDFNGVSYWVR